MLDPIKSFETRGNAIAEAASYEQPENIRVESLTDYRLNHGSLLPDVWRALQSDSALEHTGDKPKRFCIVLHGFGALRESGRFA